MVQIKLLAAWSEESSFLSSLLAQKRYYVYLRFSQGTLQNSANNEETYCQWLYLKLV